MTKPKSFEDYLKDFHAEDYHGTDDDMPDAFDNWLGELDGEDYIKFGEMAVTEAYIAGMHHGVEIAHSPTPKETPKTTFRTKQPTNRMTPTTIILTTAFLFAVSFMVATIIISSYIATV